MTTPTPLTVRRPVVALAAIIACTLAAAPSLAGPGCSLPDNGAGSADLPPVGCTYLTPDDDLLITDGLPTGTLIRIDGTLGAFVPGGGGVCSFQGVRMPGGSLGGEMVCSSAVLQMPMVGFGALAGFNRNIPLSVSLELHSGPRTPFAQVQSFPTDMVRLFGQISGDPDFALLRVTAGTDFGLPSPGHATLTRIPGPAWHVDSFFDITYRIDFVGAPGGPLDGYSGSTTGTVRLSLIDAPGACCNPATGACANVLGSACLALGGTFMGPGLSCAVINCRPVGACCRGTSCEVLTRDACGTGRYLGDGTACVCPSGVNVCCPADFNNSGSVGVQDIFDFFAAYFAGCP